MEIRAALAALAAVALVAGACTPLSSIVPSGSASAAPPSFAPSAGASAAPPLVAPSAIALAAPPPALRLFRPPFDGNFPATNLFDHDVPLEFEDANGRFVTFWGQNIRVNIDGHDGYDWIMPEGTPLLAVASGTISLAGAEAAFVCPPLDGRTVAGLWVNVDHRVTIDGVPTVIRSGYGHLGRIDVKVGDTVAEGQRIGLSGNSGCSTEPHLHFQTFRPVGQRYVRFDPFGWEGPSPDPWAADARGTASIAMWREAPPLYREARLAPNPGPKDNGSVAITAVRWLGYRDDLRPNQQFAELTVDPRFAPSGSVDMTGWTLRNTRGDVFTFPRGFLIRAGSPVRVYAGSGQNTATALYWGRSSGVWNALGDCARLINPGGGRYLLSTGGSCN